MLKFFVIVLAIIIIAMVIFDRYFIHQRNKLSNELIKEISKGNFNKVYEMEKNPKIVRFIPPFNRKLLSMNTALIENNHKKIITYFDDLAANNIASNQKKSVFMPGLQYFVSVGDSKRCKICIDELKTLNMSEDTKQYLDEINSVIVLKKIDLLDTLLERANDPNNFEVFTDEFLIAEIYNTLKNKKLAEEYLQKAQKHMDEYIQNSAN